MLDFSRVGDWIIAESDFDPGALGKAEANFCLGNGYLGLRSATTIPIPPTRASTRQVSAACGSA